MDPGNLFSGLKELRLAGNGLQDLKIPADITPSRLEDVKYLGLERNSFEDLDCLQDILQQFPCLARLSLQSNQISLISHALPATSQSYPHIEALNLSDNKIVSYQFFNTIPELLPNLASLQATNNPLFRQDVSLVSDSSRAQDKSFYLTLARLPTLRTLNYANISSRDRQEGELYYLSIVEKELRDLLASGTTVEELKCRVAELHPLYPALIEKYDRDSILNSPGSISNGIGGFPDPKENTYPAGSLGARLVTATFYLSQPNNPSGAANNSDSKHVIVTMTLPSSLPVKQLMSILLRHPTFRPHLRPLQFNLIFESAEFDPVDTTAESTTRSAMYGMTAEQKQNLWKEWGNWDADALVEQALQQVENGQIGGVLQEQEQWTQDGEFQIRDGRKWKRREVSIPHSLKRAWGDWLDDTKEVVVRLEPCSQR